MAQQIASLYAEITADTKGLERGLDRTEQGLKKAAGSAQQTGSRFTEMASRLNVAQQAFGMTAAAAGQVWSVLEEGAALNLAKDRFDNLTASIGTTSDALTNDLKAATGGMVSDADLMTSATSMISLGLGKTSDEIVDLVSLTSQLGWDQQQLVMTLANNSTMRLDALGLSMEDVQKRAKALEAQGYSTDKAFDMAVIQAGQAKLELLGSAADTGAGAMQRLTVQWENMTTAAKGFIALRSEGALLGVANTFDAVGEASDAGHSGLRNFLVVVNEIGKTLPGTGEGLNDLIDLMFESENAVVAAAEAVSVYDDKLLNVTTSAYAAEQAQMAHMEQLLNVDSELRVNMETASNAALANSELADKVGMVANHMSETQGMIAAANAAILNQNTAVDYSNVTWEKLINQLPLFDTEPIVKEMYDGERSAISFGTAVEGLAMRLGAVPSEVFVKIRVTREGDAIPGEGSYDGSMGGGAGGDKDTPNTPPPATPPSSGSDYGGASLTGSKGGGGGGINVEQLNIYTDSQTSGQKVAQDMIHELGRLTRQQMRGR